MTGQSIFPRLFRWIRPAGLAIGLLLSILASYDWLITVRLAVLQPLAIVPDSETWTPDMLTDALAGLGLPAGFFSAFSLIFSVLFTLAFLACGWLIMLRRSRDWFGLYLGLILLIWSDSVGVYYSVPPIEPWLEQTREYLAWIGWPGLFLILYFFPSGHVTPRWARSFAALLGGIIAYGLIATVAGIEIINVWIGFGIILPCLLIGGYAQVYRFRHAGLVERQQVKWVVQSLLIFIVFFFAQVVLINILQIGDPSRYELSTALLGSIGLVALATLVYTSLPVSITLAMLRYRLWDVDVIIRRTLQYSVLTGLLVMVYFGGVVLLQGFFDGFTGESGSPFVTVLTTLLIAALFNPLRRRVQEFIDRRFFRSKYDAEQALARFSTIARDEVDLERLAGSVMDVVGQTVQPVRTSLWISNLPRAAFREGARPEI